MKYLFLFIPFFVNTLLLSMDQDPLNAVLYTATVDLYNSQVFFQLVQIDEKLSIEGKWLIEKKCNDVYTKERIRETLIDLLSNPNVLYRSKKGCSQTRLEFTRTHNLTDLNRSYCELIEHVYLHFFDKK